MSDFWTQERETELASLWASGESAAVIAQRWYKDGATKNMVIGRVRMLNLPQRVTRSSTSGAVYGIKAKPGPRNPSGWKAKRLARRKPEPKPMVARPQRAATPKVERHKQQPFRAPNMLDPIPIEPTPIKADAWEPLPGTVPIPLEHLERGACKWPIGTELPFLFCGQEALRDQPYCEHHTRRAGGPPAVKLRAPRQ